MFLADYILNPGFARRLIDLVSGYKVEVAKAALDLGADAVISGDDYAYRKGLLMSPRQFREFILPYLKRLVNAVHRRGAPFIKHCDGYIWPILGDLVEAGIDGLHPIEPLAGMSIAEVKERYGDRICVAGNVDVSYVLPLGSREDVAKETRRCISEASPGGGHILSSSNSIHNAVKVENLKAMIETAKKYGVYPQGTPF